MSYFTDRAPWIMALLMRDLGLDVTSAAAILGNLGHESAGFKALQEKKPLVPGSKGGYGWAQWTGPRRDAYEDYCRRNGYDPASDMANYKYLFVELKGSEKAAIPAVMSASGLEAKVRAFEAKFERAGVKHYDSRNKWAGIALSAWNAAAGQIQIPAWARDSEAITDDIGLVVTGLMQNASGDEVTALQRLLKTAGYAVGAIDGKFGNLTRDAVLAFQAAAGLPTTGIADRETLRRLAIAKPRPVDIGRQNAAVDDLRKKGSQIIKLTDWLKKLAVGTGIIGGLGAVTGPGDRITSILERVVGVQAGSGTEPAISSDIIGTAANLAIGLLGTKGGLGVLAIGAAVLLWRNAGQIAGRRTMEHRTAVNLDK